MLNTDAQVIVVDGNSYIRTFFHIFFHVLSLSVDTYPASFIVLIHFENM